MSRAMNQRSLPLRVFLAQLAIAAACVTQGSPAKAEGAPARFAATPAVAATAPIAQESGSARPATAPAPVLISIHGTEHFFCSIANDTPGMGDYVLEVSRDGSTQGTVFYRPLNAAPGDPPTGVSFFHGTLTPTELSQLKDRINAARLGIQGACTGGAAFFNNGQGQQRVYWYGKAGRENDFVLDEGGACPNAVEKVVEILLAIFERPEASTAR